MPSICLLLFLAFAGFMALLFYGVASMMKSTDAYQMAIIEARKNPQVISELGKPVSEGFFATGSINTDTSSGSADMAIPVYGPKAGATLYVSALKSTGKWKLRELVLEMDKTKKRIDLLENENNP